MGCNPVCFEKCYSETVNLVLIHFINTSCYYSARSTSLILLVVFGSSDCWMSRFFWFLQGSPKQLQPFDSSKLQLESPSSLRLSVGLRSVRIPQLSSDWPVILRPAKLGFILLCYLLSYCLKIMQDAATLGFMHHHLCHVQDSNNCMFCPDPMSREMVTTVDKRKNITKGTNQ